MADEHSCDPSCANLRRREFLGAAALTALALLEAACGDGQIGPTATSASDTGGTVVSGNKLVVTVASYSALATTGGAARVDAGNGLPVALVRTGATTFLALSLQCPHEGFTIDVQPGGFYGRNHGARFTGNGIWTTSAQRTTNMVSLPLTYDVVAGTVTITR